MLVISRKRGEALVVQLPDGSTINVRVQAVKGRVATLGIEAPPEVRLLRGEVLERERRAAEPPLRAIMQAAVA
jgi:carbon storage regulator CsrA